MHATAKTTLLALLFPLVAVPVAARAQVSSTEPYEAIIPETKVGLSPSYGSIIPLRDGRLLWVWGSGRTRKPLQPFYQNLSTDGGRTWSDPAPLVLESGEPLTGVFNAQLVRLRSGKLGLFVAPEAGPDSVAFHVSENEGKTWSAGVPVGAPPAQTTGDKAIVLSTGRIVVPVYSGVAGPKLPSAKPKRMIHGNPFGLNGINRFWYSYIYFSDDEGRSWKRSANEVFILLDKGMRGLYGADEASVVELKDGKLLMLARTGLGRVFQSVSADGGETWLEPEPTALVSPPAPTALARIPSTGDLLVIWQQVSNWEGMIGLYRHRLSAAISRDEGKTWENHRNLESLDDTTVVEGTIGPMFNGVYRQPLDRVRYHRAPGPLRVSYPTLTFLDDRAIVSYGLSSLGEDDTLSKVYGTDARAVFLKLGLGELGRANKIRVLPIRWFYEQPAKAVARK